MSAFLKELEALNAPVAEIPDLEDYNFDNKVKAKSSRRTDDSDAEPEHDEVVLQRRRITGAVELHDPRYRGEKVSRADMFGDSSEMRGLRAKKRGMDSDEDDEEDDDGSEEGDDDGEEEEESDDDDIRLDELNGEGEEEEDDDGSDVEEDEDDEKEGRGEEGEDEEGKISMKDLLKPIAEDEERKKGESVRKQMDMCEQILLLNIKSHGAMRAFNQLPRGELAKGLMAGTDEKTRANVNEAHKNALKLVAVLLEAERVLLGGSSQTKDLLKERKEGEKEKAAADSDDEEIESSEDEDEDEKGGKAKKGGKKSKKAAAVNEDEEDFEDDDDDGSIPDYNVEGTDDSEEEDDEEEGGEKQKGGKVESLRGLRKQCIAAEVRYEQFRSTTLQKWDGRTRLAAVGGAAAAAAKQKKADFSAFEGDVLQQIDKILSDKRRLIARTQSKRSDHERIGGVAESTHDTEIFDDDDFYQVLLRDLIERKQAVDTNDPIAMSRQWLEIEKLRQKRKKRNVDTRASKGRKLRYTVIPKLVNFWAATPEYVSWPHEKRNELFHSLFK